MHSHGNVIPRHLSDSAPIEAINTVWRLLDEFCGGVAAFVGEWRRFSDVTVRRHVQLWREKDVKTLPPAPKKISVPGPRSCVWLLLKKGEKLTEEECLARQTVSDACPAIAQGLELIQAFRKAICRRSEKRFDAWMDAVTKSQIPEFKNFVKVLQKDEAAVRAAVSSEWSNGQTEGQVNRLKMLKRQMYGRANFDLLRARVLNSP